MAVLNNLTSGQASKPILKYPSNLTSEQAQYWVQFDINVQQKSKIQFGSTAYSTEPLGRSDEFSTMSVPRPPTKKLGSSICLYMPSQIELSHKSSYGEAEIGLAVATALGGVKAIQGQGFDVKKLLDQGGEEVKKALTGVLEATIAPGAQAAQQIIDGKVTNNRTEMKFEGIDRRSFQYTFRLLPKTSDEAREIEEIVTLFRYHAMPEFEGSSGSGRTMVIPSTFNITYHPNVHLHRIGECALEGVDVKFGGDRPQFFKDHQPVETQLTLSFKELDIETKEKVAIGF